MVPAISPGYHPDFVSAAQRIETPMAQEATRVAIVTGAGRGIGRAIALRLAQADYSLALVSRTIEELAETRRLTGLPANRALIILVDLTDPAAPANLFEAALEHFGRVDVLVNNAGWAPPRTPLVKARADDLDQMIGVNLRAPIMLAQLAASHMARRSDGVIVNIASQAARSQTAGEAVYSATKAGLVAFTRACFAEFRAIGVRTSVIIPGLTDTALIPANKRLDRTAMLQPDDIASAVMNVIEAPAGVCPVAIALEPSRDPMIRR